MIDRRTKWSKGSQKQVSDLTGHQPSIWVSWGKGYSGDDANLKLNMVSFSRTLPPGPPLNPVRGS